MFNSRPTDLIRFQHQTLTFKGKELVLSPIEKQVLIQFFVHNGRLSNQEVLHYVDIPPKDYSNQKRFKNLFMSNLESKLQGILWTSSYVFKKVRDNRDNRKHYYSLNEDFFDIPELKKNQL